MGWALTTMRWAGSLWAISLMTSSSPQVEEGEDEDPDEIDEVPVEAHDLDGFVASLAAREEAGPPVVEIAADDLAGDDQQEDDADGHVRPVEARDHEEGGAELCRPPRVAPGPDALADELRPLEGLHAHEGGAEEGGHHQQRRRRPPLAAVTVIDRHRHGAAAGDEHECHDGDEDERQVLSGDLEGEDLAGI